MRVNIDEIKDSGLERSLEIPTIRIDEALRGDRAGYQAAGPATVEARLERLGRRVRLMARTSVELTSPCGRCLAPARTTVPVDFQLTLVPVEEAVESEGGSHESGEEHLSLIHISEPTRPY